MKSDRYCNISFSTGDPRPNSFVWVELAQNIPCNVQNFPTRFAIQKGITRGQNKINLFVDASSFLGGAKMWGGRHILDITFLVEIRIPDSSGQTFPYIGSVVGVEANYVKFELGEFTGDISKVGGGQLPFGPTNPPISSVIHTTTVTYDFNINGGGVGTYDLGGLIPVGAIPLFITTNPTTPLNSLGLARISLSCGADLLLPFTQFDNAMFSIVKQTFSYWMAIAVSGGIDMTIDTADLFEGRVVFVISWILP